MLAFTLGACATADIIPNSQAGAGRTASITVESPIGLPDGKILQLEGRVRDQLGQRGASVTPGPGDPAAYRLQGFCSATPENGRSQIACVWDILNQNDERSYRLVTEEQANARGSNAWALVDGPVLDRIAQATADGVIAWLPSGGNILAGTPVNALAFGGRRFYVANASGAPGDGNATLAAAMVRALRAQGETVVPSATGAYSVRASVFVGEPARGNQSIDIEWQLLDQSGRSLGNVDQKNRIAAGSLNRNWGQNADNAAKAAARGLIQLLPPK